MTFRRATGGVQHRMVPPRFGCGASSNLPVDYPRVNQFPEWFTPTRGKKYRFVDCNQKTKVEISGEKLIDGIEINSAGGEACFVISDAHK